MQVILLEKIAHLGELGDIVKVKDGYGRNFLIPQATPSAPRRQPSPNSKLAVPSSKRPRPNALLLPRNSPLSLTARKSRSLRSAASTAVSSVPSRTPTSLKLSTLSASRSRSRRSARRSAPSRHGRLRDHDRLMTDITADITVKVVAEA